MQTVLLVLLGIVAAAGALVVGAWLRSWLGSRGTRVVTCPETGRAAAVEMDASSTFRAPLIGRPQLRLRDCSRWPEREGCGQQCLAQIERAPDGCLIRTRLAEWYAGKTCVLCGKAFGQIEWHDHKPCLMSPDGATAEWQQIPAESVPDALETHRAVCWDCHVAETFRRHFPKRVVER